MLFIFLDLPNDDRVRGITLVYNGHVSTYTATSGWSSNYYSDELIYVVSRNNIRLVLDGQYYRDYPLMLDVSSWEILASVSIGEHTAIIVNETRKYGYDCWTCEIDNETTAYYDKEEGLFVHSYWSAIGPEDFHDFWMSTEEITLAQIDLASLNAIQIKQPGVILAGVFIELAVIVWLIAARLKKTE
ncbi:MAG: hypothetical protein KGD60_03715 [Candidatus Thorarchaeota archaeon]|nr:hypothetical protein [Candidatus Thorarchaeota archaeon]